MVQINMDMTEYLMSVAMYSLKYQEAFGYDEQDVSNALGYVFKFYQDDVKEYSNQELSLLVTLLSQIKKEYYDLYIRIFNLDTIKLIISKARDVKDSLTLANLITELYYMFDLIIDVDILKKIIEERGYYEAYK